MLAVGHVELPAVPGTCHNLTFEAAFAQRASLMGAHAIERVKLSVDVHQRDNPVGRLEDYLDMIFEQDYHYLAEIVDYDMDPENTFDKLFDSEPSCNMVEGSHRFSILDWNLTHVGVGFCDCSNPPAFGYYYDTDPYYFLSIDFNRVLI